MGSKITKNIRIPIEKQKRGPPLPPALLAKYDSSNKIQIPGYLVDLFSKGDSPRKDYRLGKDQVQNAL